ncbi:IclR family transcriptional regulator domain-containing protein [Neobacillus sp. B4I6]|uniref:IclR family transcriptional regulator domain-containing protein n=1 Tax=Neobacillus sp. B4I6 TaxID=3373925 RepID=UPI003D1CA2C2
MSHHLSPKPFLTTERLASSISNKANKYHKTYSKLDHVKGKPFILAIGSFEQPFFYLQGIGAIQRVLYGQVKAEYRGNKTPSYDSLLNQLADIRENGFVTSFGERVEDGVGVSVPIFDSTQKVIASLTVVGASGRMTREKVDKILPLVIDFGKTISKELGFNPNLEMTRGMNAAEFV